MSPSSAKAREAALFLHGMPEFARRNVLLHLSDGERSVVEPLLRELTELGIPNLSHADEEPIAPPHIAVDAAARVRRLSPSQVLLAQADCAPATVAMLLEIEPWPWSEAMLIEMSAERRASVLALQGCVVPSVAVANAWCELLLSAVDASTADPARVRPARNRRWFPWPR